MIYSSVGYCACGREIWIEFTLSPGGAGGSGGGGQWTARYSDDSYPELTHCPACGRRLDHEEMEAV